MVQVKDLTELTLRDLWNEAKRALADKGETSLTAINPSVRIKSGRLFGDGLLEGHPLSFA